MRSGRGQRRGKAAKRSFSSGGCAQKAGQQNVNTSDGEFLPSGDQVIQLDLPCKTNVYTVSTARVLKMSERQGSWQKLRIKNCC